MQSAYRKFTHTKRTRGTSGSAAIEFALIAPVFFLLLFASFETGMVYFADMVLTNGVQQVGRLIRTGQAQTSGMTQTAFRTTLCNQIKFLLSCDSTKLYIDVRASSSFASSSYQSPIVNGSVNANLNNYQLGTSSSNNSTNTIVLVSAYYTWQLYTPMFSTYFSNMSNNQRLLSASVAFRNEPY